jgi:hypothetical protein
MSDFDPVDIAAQDQAAATTAAKHALEAANLEADLRWLMADLRGRRLMRRILERTAVFKTTFTGEFASTAFREGERNIGLWLIAEVQATAPERLADLMMKDGHDHRGDASD